jgi:hypothetical protein
MQYTFPPSAAGLLGNGLGVVLLQLLLARLLAVDEVNADKLGCEPPPSLRF